MERVNGVWQSSGLQFANGAVSADGLTVAGITGSTQVSVFRRASESVSFAGSTQVLLNMPASSTDGSIAANLSRLTLSSNGNRIVATSMKAVPGNQYTCTATWTGSAWVLQTFSTSNPDNYQQDLHVSLSPDGNRLVQVRSDGRVFSFKYTGMPSLPWEDVGNIGFLASGATTTGAWMSNSSWAVVQGTTLRVYSTTGFPFSSLSLVNTYTKADLGFPSATAIRLLSASLNKFIISVDLYTLAECTPSVANAWRLDVAASGNIPPLGATSDGRLVLLYNGTSGTNYPNSTLLLER